MAKKSDTTRAANEMQSLFDPRGYQDMVKTMVSFNERMSAITIDAAMKSTDIATDTTHQAISNMRDVTTVRDEPEQYGQAYSDFAQKQMDLFMRTAQAYADVMQKAGTATSDLAAKTGEDMGQKAAQNANEAASKASSAAKNAA